MKSTILWIIILLLSLHAYGMYKDRQLFHESRERFYEKAKTIFDKVYWAVEERIENKTDAQLASEITEQLDYLGVYQDPDYKILSEPEKKNFHWNLGHISKLVAEILHQQSSGKPSEVPDDLVGDGSGHDLAADKLANVGP